ncbi:ABC transporter permease [Metabacillus malikii]|uniref:ABC-2 type transport system permease protein n=1 Tax=Metabacillus malikii TaxID=1504265 RepID=A0ABT9ZF38_9BACI|nr:ABC transporter permease [Metabacillus malikii]MDQ0230878.1 ABC-2 type transport system permease protein [Metabacillus malikii]
MTFSMRRSIAILQKDYKDLSKNLFVSSSALMPLILAAIYGRLGVETINEHYMVFNMVLCLVAAYVQCSLIAEEKEKNTLRGLMLSPATTFEIIIGKSLLSFIGTILIVVVAALLTGYAPENLAVVSIAIVLSTFFYIGLGTLLGLITKTIMEASIIILPFMCIFSFGDFLLPLSDTYPIIGVLEYFPNSQLIQLANEVQTGAGMIDVINNIIVIFIWIVAIFSLVTVLYRKRMID